MVDLDLMDNLKSRTGFVEIGMGIHDDALGNPCTTTLHSYQYPIRADVKNCYLHTCTPTCPSRLSTCEYLRLDREGSQMQSVKEHLRAVPRGLRGSALSIPTRGEYDAEIIRCTLD